MLTINNISKTFFPGTINEVKALRKVSLQIKEGSFTAIIGTNGSGKSTLLNAIAGTFIPDEGSIKIDGTEISRWPEYKRARMIGRVFQNPFAGSAADMTIAENIVMAMRRGQSRPLKIAVHKNIKAAIAEKVQMLKMGLEDRLDNPIGTLSGGQRQALTLLMATWLKPKLLLLDEHTAALDPKSAAKVAELTKIIIEQEKLTALMVTHSMQQAVDLPDRIVMMHRGQIVEDLRDEMKHRVRVPDLLETFNIIQKRELFDESVARLMKEQYI
ncbi:MAG: ATP-binding cassette domain-containing protein [Bacteroidales bacterium]|jgi:putative ABC transport system ATP-binding protein|nr:ATP-binding cassette domain-containing protein [Bacteroidales bacterium]HOI31534.1 ATP-binding cassette domain-containing protein [Bacteroidales bacterium]